MEWSDETLTRLSEIFGDKSAEIRNGLIASGLFLDIDSYHLEQVCIKPWTDDGLSQRLQLRT